MLREIPTWHWIVVIWLLLLRASATIIFISWASECSDTLKYRFDDDFTFDFLIGSRLIITY